MEKTQAFSKPHRNRISKAKKDYARILRARQTPAEAALWERLRKKQVGGVRFRRQHPLYGYIVDFWCPSHSLVIEVDGWFHRTNKKQARADNERTAALGSKGVLVIRFMNDEVLNDIEAVVREICQITGIKYTKPTKKNDEM